MTAARPPQTEPSEPELDMLLGRWAATPAAGAAIDVAAILALPQERAAPRRGAAWRPALLAASLALVVAVGGWFSLADRMAMPDSTRIAAAAPSAGAAAAEAEDAFAYVFTPTAAEEDLI